jgi:hypothetical protein
MLMPIEAGVRSMIFNGLPIENAIQMSANSRIGYFATR